MMIALQKVRTMMHDCWDVLLKANMCVHDQRGTQDRIQHRIERARHKWRDGQWNQADGDQPAYSGYLRPSSAADKLPTSQTSSDSCRARGAGRAQAQGR